MPVTSYHVHVFLCLARSSRLERGAVMRLLVRIRNQLSHRLPYTQLRTTRADRDTHTHVNMYICNIDRYSQGPRESSDRRVGEKKTEREKARSQRRRPRCVLLAESREARSTNVRGLTSEVEIMDTRYTISSRVCCANLVRTILQLSGTPASIHQHTRAPAVKRSESERQRKHASERA